MVNSFFGTGAATIPVPLGAGISLTLHDPHLPCTYKHQIIFLIKLKHKIEYTISTTLECVFALPSMTQSFTLELKAQVLNYLARDGVRISELVTPVSTSDRYNGELS